MHISFAEGGVHGWRALRALAMAPLALFSGCGWLPMAASPTDPRAVLVWPLAACPSVPQDAVPHFTPVVGALATPILTDIVGSIVALPVTALQNAATADKNGYSASGLNPRFYYSSVVKSADGTGNNFVRPGCYAVAYTKYVAKPSASAKSWCDDPAFKTALPTTCSTGGMAKLEAIRGPFGHETAYAPALPDFYAEIELPASSYATNTTAVVQPRVVAAYYPKSLLEPGSGKPRLIAMTLALTSPALPKGSGTPADPMVAASPTISIPAITPGAVISADELAVQQTNWLPMPISTVVAPTDPPLPQLSNTPYYPVNIQATLHEAGDPNIFLSAFATAVAGSASDYTKAIVNAVSPTAVLAAQAQNATNSATLTAANAQEQKDLGAYLTLCAANPATPAAKAAAKGAYSTVVADQQKANAAAITAGVAQPFAVPGDGISQCFN